MANKKASPKSYQKLSPHLDEIINWFESDDVNLDEAIVKYEQAIKLINELEKYLKAAENKIHKISGKSG